MKPHSTPNPHCHHEAPSTGPRPKATRNFLDLFDQIADCEACVDALARLIAVEPAIIDRVSDVATAEESFFFALRADLASNSPMRVGMWASAIEQLLALDNRQEEAEQLFREALANVSRLRSEDVLEVGERYARHLEGRARGAEANAIRHRVRVAALLAHGKVASSLASLRGIAFELLKSGEFSEAEAIYRHLLSHDFEPTGSGVHLTRCLLTVGGRDSEAEAQARLAWEQRGTAEPYQAGRALYLMALIDTLAGRDAAEHLTELGAVLKNSGARVGFTVEPMLEALRPRMTEDSFAFFKGMSEIMAGRCLENPTQIDVLNESGPSTQDQQSDDSTSRSRDRHYSRSLARGMALREAGDLEQSTQILRDLVEQESEHGRSRFYERCCAMSQLGRTLRLIAERAIEARDLHWRVLALRAQVCGRDHEYTINSAHILAQTLRILNDEMMASAVERWASGHANAPAVVDEHLRRTMDDTSISIERYIQDYLHRQARP